MVKPSAYVEYAVEQMTQWAPVSARRMFGGYGIYRDGIMFALIADDQLYFKVDECSRQSYQGAGSRPFTYENGKGKTVTMSYWELPADVLDDIGMLSMWADKAYTVACDTQHAKAVRGKRG